MIKRKMGKKSSRSICVDEEVRIAVNLRVDKFLQSDDQELEFPSSFTSVERAFIHRLASQNGLLSKSKGNGDNRQISVRKRKKKPAFDSSTLFNFGQNSSRVLHSLLHRWPVKLREKLELQPKSAKVQHGVMQDCSRPDASKTSGRLNNGIPQVPVKRGRSDLDAFRKTLPVASMADELVATVEKHPVVLICGETGSGKTTQIPQFILDDCYARGERRCRILCTQPRRISAVAMAERVAAERGECVGHTVGYQIRLESRVSPRTLLTFCTNGVLLRTLMAGDNSLSTVTHVIVDEVHERDRFCDFLLIKLRQLIQSHKSASPRHAKFKLVLMSAALDVDLFINYFSGCPVINIPGKMYDVQQYFLEDVLKLTGKFGDGASSLTEWMKVQNDGKSKSFSSENSDAEFTSPDAKSLSELESMESWRIEAMDSALFSLWHKASALLDGEGEDDRPSPFPQIFNLIQTENVPVDYRHSETGVTALMASAMHGAMEECEKLIMLGAKVSLQVSNGWTAADMAAQLGHEDLAEVLHAVIDEQTLNESFHNNDQLQEERSPGVDENEIEMSEEDRKLVSEYQQNFDDSRVDTNLIIELLSVICKEDDNGAILVFLPGYDDIVTLREMILSDEYAMDFDNIKLYLLHSSMQSSSDQKQVFKTPPAGYRKIILSTNIAETAVTIEDVVYVIDGGKIKIKIYEAITSTSTLKSVWVSKANVQQRKGRAGRCRPGICFHLFSKARYAAMPQYQTAELLRTALHELCLQAKLLSVSSKRRRSRSDGANNDLDDCRSDSGDSIADFLSKAPEAPSRLMLDNAVNLLKTIDALDPWEDLTELGHHLVDLPIEPRLGKMVLYSVVLKCLDPVLTIACALAYKDPFLLPQSPDEKRQARSCRVKFGAGAFSDHMCLLRAFQAWQKAKSDGWERAFCDKNYLSPATMQMIIGMRTQLLGQLRAAGFVRARGGSDIRDLNTNSENWAVVKAALCASAYPSILQLDRDVLLLRSQQHKKVRFHASSVLSHGQPGKGTKYAESLRALPTDWVIYDELTMAAGHFSGLATARCCTVIAPACISLFSGPAHLPQESVLEPDVNSEIPPEYSMFDESDSEEEDGDQSKLSTLCITDWIKLKMEPQLCGMILDLRTKWYSLFLRRIRAPAKPWLPEDEAVLSTIINILSSEDQSHSLLQPSGIGQRPRPMSQEEGQRGFTGVRIRTPSKKKPDTPPVMRTGSYQKGNHCISLSGRLSASLNIEDRSTESSPCLSPLLISDCDATAKISPTIQLTYFAILCKSQKNIQISQRNGVWLTNASEEKLLSSAFESCEKIFLLVFLHNTTFCQGYARLTSPGTLFTNVSESNNFGWDKDTKYDDNELTAYFSVDWIAKTPLHLETQMIESDENSVLELSVNQGEQILSQIECQSLSQAPDFFHSHSANPTQPFVPNTYPFPTLPPANMFNPYQGVSPVHPMYPGYPQMGQFYNPYQYPQHQPAFTQPIIPPTSTQPINSCNFLRQNK